MLEGRQRAAVWAAFIFGFALASILVLREKPTVQGAEPGATHALAVTTVAEPALGAGELVPQVVDAATRHRLDPALVLAVIQVESGSDANALSEKGAVGLMQVLPETAALVGLPEAADPRNNLEAGCRYLAALLDAFGGDAELALAAYNAGPGAVRRWGSVPPYQETRTFVTRVGAAYERLTGLDMRTATRLAMEWEGLPLF